MKRVARSLVIVLFSYLWTSGAASAQQAPPTASQIVVTDNLEPATTQSAFSSCSAIVFTSDGVEGESKGLDDPLNQDSIACSAPGAAASTSVSFRFFVSSPREFTVAVDNKASAGGGASSETTAYKILALTNNTNWSVPVLVGGISFAESGGARTFGNISTSVAESGYGQYLAIVKPNTTDITNPSSVIASAHAHASAVNSGTVALSNGKSYVYFPTMSIYLNWGDYGQPSPPLDLRLPSFTCKTSGVIPGDCLAKTGNSGSKAGLDSNQQGQVQSMLHNYFSSKIGQMGVPPEYKDSAAIQDRGALEYQVPIWSSSSQVAPAANSIIVDMVGDLLEFGSIHGMAYQTVDGQPGGSATGQCASIFKSSLSASIRGRPGVDQFDCNEGGRVVVSRFFRQDGNILSLGIEDLVETIIHEIGHAVGLFHTNDGSNMNRHQTPRVLGYASTVTNLGCNDRERQLGFDCGLQTNSQNSLYHFQKFGLDLPSTLASGTCDVQDCRNRVTAVFDFSPLTPTGSGVLGSSVSEVWELFLKLTEGLDLVDGAEQPSIFTPIATLTKAPNGAFFSGAIEVTDLAMTDLLILYGDTVDNEFFFSFSSNTDAAPAYTLGAEQLLAGGTLYLIASDKVTGQRSVVGTVGVTGFIPGDCNAYSISVPQGNTQTQAAPLTNSCELRKLGEGAFTLTEANTYTGGTSVLGGTLIVRADNNLGDASGLLNLDGGGLQAVETFQTARKIVIGSSDGEIGVAPLMTLTHTGILSGAGILTKSGGGQLELAGDLRGYAGLLAIDAGKVSTTGTFGGDVAVNAGAELKTNGAIARSLFVGGGGRFTGNAQVAGPVTNNGTIAPGNSYGVQHILSNYAAGGSARLDMEAWLLSPLVAANGITHDTLTIAGNVTGRTLINIIPGPTPNARTLFDALPDAITLRGKALVEVDGTVASNAFAMAAPVRKHGFDYSLQYMRNFRGQTDGFFLKARPRNELLAFASLLAAGRALLAQCGSRRNLVDANLPSFAADILASDVDEGTGSHHNFKCDAETLSLVERDGISLAVRSGAGLSSGELSLAEAGGLEGDVKFVQGVAHIERAGFGIDITAGYLSGDWNFDAMPIVAEGVVASLAVERRAEVGPFEFSLNAGINFDDTTCDRTCPIEGIGRTGQLLEGRAEARVEAAFFDGALQPYLGVSYAEALSGSSDVLLEEARVRSASDEGRTSLSVGAALWSADRVKFSADMHYVRDVAASEPETFSGAVAVAMQW